MFQVKDRAGLEAHFALWNQEQSRQSSKPLPIGYILSLEGADSVLDPANLEKAFAQGLRAIGPSHYGPGIYAQGTDATGGLGPRGKDLLREMDRFGIILDATHLCDDSFWEALDYYTGPVWASHNNCRALVPHNRQFSDEQIKELIARGAVIGAALDAWMMVPGWIKKKTIPESVGLKLERILDHMDHICQLAGNANHSGIGTDLDGGFGREQSPGDLDTIAGFSAFPICSPPGVTPGRISRRSCTAILWVSCGTLGNNALPDYFPQIPDPQISRFEDAILVNPSRFARREVLNNPVLRTMHY